MIIAPLLALESTVITHGLPFPDNLAIARELEATACAHGATPRTLAVLSGQIKIGLTDAELDHLARAENVMKLSRRDIALAIVKGRDGATTASATMFLAHRAGIRVFATGGIGGVHRWKAVGRSQAGEGLRLPPHVMDIGLLSSDISADLVELATTPVVVVCAGAKAILDLSATVEFLETYRVPVLGFQTEDFPAFYSRQSGLKVQARIDWAADVAAIARAHWSLGNRTAVLVSVPIPLDDEIPRQVMEPYIECALVDAVAEGIVGNAVTPFVLRRLADLTEGASVKANRALLKNNVAVGAEIAVELARLDVPVV